MPILCLHHSQKYNVSNKCFSHLRYQHRRQNAVIQTCLLAPTLEGTRRLKPGHMEFSPVSAGKTRQHKQTFRTNTKNPSWTENCLRCGEDHGITIPPHDFRQQDNQQRFCPDIVENNITIAETGRWKRTNSYNRENAASPLNQHVSRNQ